MKKTGQVCLFVLFFLGLTMVLLPFVTLGRLDREPILLLRNGIIFLATLPTIFLMAKSLLWKEKGQRRSKVILNLLPLLAISLLGVVVDNIGGHGTE